MTRQAVSGRRPVVFRCGLQGDGVVELLELVDEVSDAVFGGAATLCPVWALADPATTDVGVVGGKVGVFRSRGGVGGFGQSGA